MKKGRIFTLFFVFLILFSVVVTPFSFTASAYTPSSFEVRAENALLINLDDNSVLYEKNADEKVYPTALTKIMTAVIMIDKATDINNDSVPVTASVLNALKGSSYNAYNLTEGEKIPAIDLLYLIMLASSNEAAEIAAEYYGGGQIQKFINMMNDKAIELGMTNTRYVNATGFQDENQYTTVKDLYKLTQYAMSLDVFKTVVNKRLYEMPPTNLYNKTRYILTTDWLRDNTTQYYYRYATGIKTGYSDESGRCIVASATKDKKNYVCILMNSPDVDADGKDAYYEYTDAQNLLEWAFNDFTQKIVLTTKEPAGEAKVKYGQDTDHVTVYPAKEIVATIPESADTSTIISEVHLNQEEFEAPIQQGDVLGYVTVSYAGVELGKTDLIASESVEKNAMLSALGQVKATVQTVWFKLIILGIIALIIIRTLIIQIKRSIRKKRRKVKDYRRM